jgi:hypothetical protein
LTELYLCGCQLDPGVFEALSQRPSIRLLDLSNTNVDSKMLKGLTTLPKLEQVCNTTPFSIASRIS